MFVVNVLHGLVFVYCCFVGLVCLFMLCLCCMFIDLMVVGYCYFGSICCLGCFLISGLGLFA